MKLSLDKEEKKLLTNQLYQLAIDASQIGDRKLHKELLALADDFHENALVSYIKRHEALFLLDTTIATVETLKTNVLPKIQKTDKTDKEKEESIATINQLISTSNSIIEKVQKRLDETDDQIR